MVIATGVYRLRLLAAILGAMLVVAALSGCRRSLEIGVREQGGTFRPLQDGDLMAVVLGANGLNMVVPSLWAEGINPRGPDPSVEVAVDGILMAADIEGCRIDMQRYEGGHVLWDLRVPFQTRLCCFNCREGEITAVLEDQSGRTFRSTVMVRVGRADCPDPAVCCSTPCLCTDPWVAPVCDPATAPTPESCFGPVPGTDAGATTEAGVDSGVDAGVSTDAAAVADSGTDSGTAADAGVDSGVVTDAGGDSGTVVDAGVDSGVDVDSGVSMDAGADAGSASDSACRAGAAADDPGGCSCRLVADARRGCSPGADHRGALWLLGLMAFWFALRSGLRLRRSGRGGRGVLPRFSARVRGAAADVRHRAPGGHLGGATNHPVSPPRPLVS